jgi:hypothetical protein
MPNHKLSKEEHQRRLSLYSPYSSYEKMGKLMFLSSKGVESWIRRSGLKQPEGIKKKLMITSRIKIWEYRNGVVGKNIKRRTYVKDKPVYERLLIRSFITDLINFSEKSVIPLKGKCLSRYIDNWRG